MITLTELLINNEDYTDYAVWTLQGQNTLDESLDVQYIELKGTDKQNPFTPFDDIQLTITDGTNNKIFEMLVESDTVTEVIANKKYDHKLLFIERTKWLERLFVEKTIRQPLIHDYSELTSKMFTTAYSYREAPGPVTERHDDADSIDLFNSVLHIGETYEIYNPLYLMYQIQEKLPTVYYFLPYNGGSSALRSATLKIYSPSNEVVYNTSASANPGTLPTDKFSFTPTEQGSYRFELEMPRQLYASGGYYITGSSSFYVSAVIIENQKPDYTIRDTVNLLLDTCITIREKETPLFQLAEPSDYTDKNTQYRQRIQKILDTTSPEFTFNKMSLFEALKMVGDYAHFIPRLKGNKIYFDLLGRMDKANIDVLGEYSSNVASQSSNNFCNALDSKVNNLTNMDDVEQGSVATPNKRSMRTLRVADGTVQLTDKGIIIPTEDNIEQVIKLEIGYLKNEPEPVGDITQYVFEEDEYNALSSYANTYPTSKMYAIKYKKGSRNITGLDFKRQNPVSGSFETIAIKNIIYRKCNRDMTWWNTLWSVDEDVFKIQYRLTYIPSTDTKVTQYKADKQDIREKPLYIAYNQSASKVSSDAYGENLKGNIAKIGNIEKTKMYILPTFDLIPECGTLFDDDYYISVVKYEVYPNFIKCELGLSKNYNNKSAYVEINSQLEFFEYDRSIIIDRYVVYEDFCEIGDFTQEELSQSSTSLISNTGLNGLFDALYYSYDDEVAGSPYIIDSVVAKGYDANNNPLTEVVLPVISLGVGNSLLFTYHYEDSVSAGNFAFTSGATKYQNFVKYTDIYGEVDKLKLGFGLSSLNNKKDNYTDAVELGDSLPQTSDYDTTDNNFFVTPDDDKIVLKKGVGEIIHFTYQLHFVSNRPSLVIGSGLTRKSIYTTEEPMKYRLYVLPNKINKFETKIDLTDAVACGRMYPRESMGDSKWISVDPVTVPQGTYKSWVIVHTYNNSNDLVIGENIDLEGGDLINIPTFKFKRRIK